MCVTDASLDVDIVAPLPVPQTADEGLVEPRAGEAPPLSSAVILDGRGVGPGMDTVNTSPVGHPQVVLVDGEGSLSAVDGCKQNVGD